MMDECKGGTMTMRAILAAFVLCLLVLVTGSAWSSSDAPGACPELAFTDSFKARGLGYVYTEEFAEAVSAVASGASTYSPPEIPSGWRTAAVEWRAYVAAHPAGGAETMQTTPAPALPGALSADPYLSKDACSPALLYLASLHYRSRTGGQGATPVFPRIVKSGVMELGTQVVAKRRMTATYAKRGALIGEKIADAERMGAKDCSPSELARAKAELDRARVDAAGIRSGIEETDASFARAEQIADALLANRQFASRTGIKCIPE
jgi:hypothetical protein